VYESEEEEVETSPQGYAANIRRAINKVAMGEHAEGGVMPRTTIGTTFE
jgi:hypothetical protein